MDSFSCLANPAYLSRLTRRAVERDFSLLLYDLLVAKRSVKPPCIIRRGMFKVDV